MHLFRHHATNEFCANFTKRLSIRFSPIDATITNTVTRAQSPEHEECEMETHSDVYPTLPARKVLWVARSALSGDDAETEVDTRGDDNIACDTSHHLVLDSVQRTCMRMTRFLNSVNKGSRLSLQDTKELVTMLRCSDFNIVALNGVPLKRLQSIAYSERRSKVCRALKVCK